MAKIPKPEELLKTVEAVLFSYGKKVELEEIARLCRARNYADVVKEALNLLKQDYDEKQCSLMVVQDGNFWKLTTRERFSNVVSRIVPHTELSKTILETLSILAWKAPMRQSELVEIRTNKAYDHVNALADSGFISKEKYGRTYLLKLTQKFFDYFDLKDIDDAHKMFDKVLPEKEKKEIEKKIQAAKQAADAEELAEELPKVEAEKPLTKASLASELVAAAKNIKVGQPVEREAIEREVAEQKQAQEEKEEEKAEEAEQKQEPEEQEEPEKTEDLEDDVAEAEVEELEEALPEADLDETKQEKDKTKEGIEPTQEDELSKPEED